MLGSFARQDEPGRTFLRTYSLRHMHSLGTVPVIIILYDRVILSSLQAVDLRCLVITRALRSSERFLTWEARPSIDSIEVIEQIAVWPWQLEYSR